MERIEENSEEESDYSAEEEVQIFKANKDQRPREGRKTYSMRAAQEIQALPVLPLNHAHAQRFREMRLDAQMQQVGPSEGLESTDSRAVWLQKGRKSRRKARGWLENRLRIGGKSIDVSHLDRPCRQWAPRTS